MNGHFQIIIQLWKTNVLVAIIFPKMSKIPQYSPQIIFLKIIGGKLGVKRIPNLGDHLVFGACQLPQEDCRLHYSIKVHIIVCVCV